MDLPIVLVFIAVLGWLLSDLPIVRQFGRLVAATEEDDAAAVAEQQDTAELPAEQPVQAQSMFSLPAQGQGNFEQYSLPPRDAQPLFGPDEGLVRLPDPSLQLHDASDSRSYLSDRQDGVAPFQPLMTTPLLEGVLRVMPKVLTTKSEDQLPRGPAVGRPLTTEGPSAYGYTRLASRPEAAVSMFAMSPPQEGGDQLGQQVDLTVHRGDLQSGALQIQGPGVRQPQVAGLVQSSALGFGDAQGQLRVGNPTTSGLRQEGPSQGAYLLGGERLAGDTHAPSIPQNNQTRGQVERGDVWQLPGERLSDAERVGLPNEANAGVGLNQGATWLHDSVSDGLHLVGAAQGQVTGDQGTQPVAELSDRTAPEARFGSNLALASTAAVSETMGVVSVAQHKVTEGVTAGLPGVDTYHSNRFEGGSVELARPLHTDGMVSVPVDTSGLQRFPTRAPQTSAD